MSEIKISWSDVDWYKFYIHLRSLKIPRLLYWKGPLKKMITEIQLVGVCMIFHCTLLRLSKCNGPWVVSIKQNANFKFQPPAIYVLLVFREIGLIKSRSFSEDLSELKISWSNVDWCKFCTHLRSFNVRHLGIVAHMALKITVSRSPSMAWPSPWISQVYQLVQRLIGGDRHTDKMVISLAYIFPLGRKVG
jgi:hypothetical protein